MLFSCAIQAFVLHGVSGWANSAASPQPIKRENDRPNIVIILTDDQDVHLNSMDYLPLVKQHMTDKGTSFNRHFCTVALCCPSRVTLWTGKAAHNTVSFDEVGSESTSELYKNVTSVRMPYGGYPKFVDQGLNDNYLPVWLQEAGYRTYYTGKLFNSHGLDNYDKPFARGFTGNDFLLDPTTYQYLNASIQTNHDPLTLAYIDDAMTTDEPFFIVSSPIAPHADQIEDILSATAPIPAERHKDLFRDSQVPRTPSFNPDYPSGGGWIRLLPQQNDTNVEYNDERHRSRLRALQAVEELMEGVINKLTLRGLLDNTYIIYTSDNGYHIGQHRLQPGKMCGYEEDVNVPMIIRGPGIKEGATTSLVTSHTDLAPTILSLLGAPQRPDFDGTPIPVKAEELFVDNKDWQEHVGVEYWGPSVTTTCSKPWSALHPAGNVLNLKDAMAEKFDDFYAGREKVGFDECANGYIVEVEGPQFETDGFQYLDSD